MIYFVQEDYFPSKVAGGSAKSVKLMSELFRDHNLESQIITSTQKLSLGRDDIIILNSMFGKTNRMHVYRLARCKAKVIVIPRGELSVASMSNRRKMKAVYLYLVRFLGVYKNVNWVATSEEELRRIKCWFRKAQVDIIPNLMEIPSAIDQSRDTRRGLCSIGRLELKKNQTWLENLNREIDIIGHKSPREESYWSNILRSSRLSYLGNTAPEEINNVYRKYAINLLPTLNENFGHVIVESILNGLPVIVSENTPWTVIINKNGFGKSLPLNPGLWDEAIEEIMSNYSSYQINCRKSVTLFNKMNNENKHKWTNLIKS